jgi:acyl-CoA thioesterase-1
LSAYETEQLIEQIPSVVTASDEAVVLSARFAFNALSQPARDAVSNLAKLIKAEDDMAALLSPVRVACVGDSITRGLSYSSNPDTNSYPALLQQSLGLRYTVQNFGVGGSTLLKKGDKPYWNQPEFTASTDFAPQIVIIMLGTNDAKPKNWQYKSEFTTDLTALVNHYRELPSAPAVYIATSPTAYFNAMNVTDDVISGEIVSLQKKTAADLKCPVIDVNAATKNNVDLFTDGIHPNNDGYAVIAQAMRAIGAGYTNAKLAELTVNGAALNGFDPSTTSYTVELTPGTTTIPTIAARAEMPDAKIVVTQASAIGETANITVTAQNGSSVTYTVRFTLGENTGSSSSQETTSQTTTQPTETTSSSSENSQPDVQTGEPRNNLLPIVCFLAALITAGAFIVLRWRSVQKAQ